MIDVIMLITAIFCIGLLFGLVLAKNILMNIIAKSGKVSPEELTFKMRKIEPPPIISIISSKGFLYRLWFMISTPFVWLIKGQIKIK